MNGMLKWAMAGVIAFSFGSAWAQAARTGKEVLNDNTNKWNPLGPYATYSGESALTGTFHAGGVAACDGCHVMHNASGGVARSTKVAPWTNAVPAFLLQGSDQSSTCLICHGDATSGAGTGITSKPYVITNTGTDFTQMNYTPGGDFGWLQQDGGTRARHGHNVVAADFPGFVPDSMTTAPGGTFTAGSGLAAFACSNCHDPHGRYRMELDTASTWKWAGPVTGGPVAAITQPIYSSGSYGMLPTTDGAIGAYRLLAGYGYVPASNPAGVSTFTNNPPVAVAPPAYNHSEAGAVTNQVRVAYGTGMSEWCQNCHTNIHLDSYTSGAMGASGLKHPAGQGAVLKPGQFSVYNTYISSGKFGVSTERYTSLVPFENAGKVGFNTSDLTRLANAAAGTDTSIFVADSQSNVMCLSCHRAHASGFDSMVRWNADDTFITSNDLVNFVDSQDRNNNDLLKAAYYGRSPTDFGLYQRSLCNKCHGKD